MSTLVALNWVAQVFDENDTVDGVSRCGVALAELQIGGLQLLGSVLAGSKENMKRRESQQEECPQVQTDKIPARNAHGLPSISTAATATHRMQDVGLTAQTLRRHASKKAAEQTSTPKRHFIQRLHSTISHCFDHDEPLPPGSHWGDAVDRIPPTCSFSISLPGIAHSPTVATVCRRYRRRTETKLLP